MFIYDTEQKIFDIAGLKIGGQPGEVPTVMAGTIFYAGHKIVEDDVKGIIDEKSAEELINKQDEMSDITGNPAIIQIFAEASEAMERYIEFCTKISDSPFLIDSTDASARIAGTKYVQEVGLTDKAVYNSLNVSCTPEEMEALKDSDISSSIVLGFNPKDASVSGKVELLDTGAGLVDKGLLDLSEDLGITKPLIDPASMPIGAGAGSSVASGFVIKSKFGVPVGLGIHNAPSSWVWLKEYRRAHAEHPERGVWIGEGGDVYRFCDIGSNVVPIIAGQDFVLYGPIENAAIAFPLCAMADIIVSEANQVEHGITPIESHPYFKMSE
ncbi:MAG: tetrahydromethanopterin S-methyltransferase subunit H [Candidatus Methanolliviera hydrocarbonicum]|uniref:Tetrahydromethanopterin S-methyltransferase subunit H n=1 Tax=Candidatus Methanolliviera hydrocarbonicum TaxID=2491085 RepID=A0A520KXA4_9EURY|nr:MAG: tetrahydromethanopterin S-methyltransferase subunit H [Candidatus Methanolliviera hydrocarbonicum]